MAVRRVYTNMLCKETGEMEPQFVVKEDVDGITLECSACGQIHAHEIGFFAHLYQNLGGEGKTKTYRQEYECGCSYLFNVDDMHNWKLIDFTLCDDCCDEFTSWWVSPSGGTTNG